eukprot:13030247-Heterocapsa_arctica.AAC.1
MDCMPVVTRAVAIHSFILPVYAEASRAEVDGVAPRPMVRLAMLLMASLAPVLCSGLGESRSSFAAPYEPCPTLSAVSG